jgi:membrane protein YdbS with pleckstrin-like domain
MRGDHRYLAQDEEIILQVHRHGSVLLRPLFTALGMIFIAAVIGFLTSPSEGGDLIDMIVGVVALFFVLRLLWRIWEWRADRVVVTDRRIFEVSGLLSRKVASMPLAKMTDITYRRSILGRLLGFGELVVETAGQDQSLHKLDHLPKPDEFYRTITWLVTGGLMERPDLDDLPHHDEDDTGPLPRVIV